MYVYRNERKEKGAERKNKGGGFWLERIDQQYGKCPWEREMGKREGGTINRKSQRQRRPIRRQDPDDEDDVDTARTIQER